MDATWHQKIGSCGERSPPPGAGRCGTVSFAPLCCVTGRPWHDAQTDTDSDDEAPDKGGHFMEQVLAAIGHDLFLAGVVVRQACHVHTEAAKPSHAHDADRAVFSWRQVPANQPCLQWTRHDFVVLSFLAKLRMSRFAHPASCHWLSGRAVG